MDQPAIANLTERERLFLSLVATCNNSSEIARAATAELGKDVSTTTVDRVIKDAMAKLGVKNRYRAAQMLTESRGSPRGPTLAPSERPLSGHRRFRLPLPVPTPGRPTNDLTVLQNIALIIVVAIGLGIGITGLMAIARTLYQLALPIR